jgi:hypothetical protein
VLWGDKEQPSVTQVYKEARPDQPTRPNRAPPAPPVSPVMMPVPPTPDFSRPGSGAGPRRGVA